MKLRPFEIKLNGDDKYTIKIDGKTAATGWNKAICDELKSYHPDLAAGEATEEMVSAIIQELNLEFNLTEQESQEYTQTLKYILEG